MIVTPLLFSRKKVAARKNFSYLCTYMRQIFNIALLAVAILASPQRANSRPAIPQDFVTAPRDIVSALDSITRVEMLLYHQAASPTPSKNLLGGSSRVISLSPGMITFSTSEASETTMAQLPARGDSVMLVLNTVSLPALDSDAIIYNSSWQRLPQKSQLPSLNNLNLWLTPEGKKHVKEVENAVPFITAKYTFDPSTQTLTAVSTLRRVIGKENYDSIDSYLKPSLQYKWNGNKWIPVK